jgi:hypothetical protein
MPMEDNDTLMAKQSVNLLAKNLLTPNYFHSEKCAQLCKEK